MNSCKKRTVYFGLKIVTLNEMGLTSKCFDALLNVEAEFG